MATKKTDPQILISEPNLRHVVFSIEGNAPYVQNKFSFKARKEIEEKQSQVNKKKKAPPRDFNADYNQAMHISTEKWHGIPAPAFRAGMISACRIIGFKMTLAKMAIFVVPDGFDADDASPLIRITEGKPEIHESHVRIAMGTTTVSWRPMWKPGWKANVLVRYDADMFSVLDVTNLMKRVGAQVGIGEGRPDSKNSVGMGWGTFDIKHVNMIEGVQ